MIRFLLDENVPHAIARGLRLRGVEVATTSETGLLSVDDDAIAEFALEGGYVIFTQDDDFLRIASKGAEHGGIVYAKQGSRTLGEIIRYLVLMADCLEPSDMKDKVEFL